MGKPAAEFYEAFVASHSCTVPALLSVGFSFRLVVVIVTVCLPRENMFVQNNYSNDLEFTHLHIHHPDFRPHQFLFTARNLGLLTNILRNPECEGGM
jgi:hypothetical protein